MGYPWQVALGANLITGLLFVILTFFGLRELITSIIPDSLGTVAGALLGTSTVSSYVESSAGIQAGGRTGLSNIFTAGLLLLSLLFYPLIKMIGGGHQTPDGNFLYPIIAPALIIVGSMMIFNVKKINWEDPTEALPSFLTLAIMPFSMSITERYIFLKN